MTGTRSDTVGGREALLCERINERLEAVCKAVPRDQKPILWRAA